MDVFAISIKQLTTFFNNSIIFSLFLLLLLLIFCFLIFHACFYFINLGKRIKITFQTAQPVNKLLFEQLK